MAGMKWKKALVPLAIVIVLAIVAVAVYLVMNPVDTTLEFEVRDAVSKAWVYDASLRLEGRLIRSYFQSDQGVEPQRFTHLKPGRAALELSAPAYQPVTRELTLKRGANRLPEPIDLVGLEIPELKSFIMFEDLVGSDVHVEIRPVSNAGPAVLNHPCLDLWIGARMTVQQKNGLPVQEETEAGSVRGEELFRGRIDWKFDPYPETVFRYSAVIPGAKIKPSKAPYRVVDYLVVLPHPLAIGKQELDGIMAKAMELKPEAVEEYLRPFEEQGKIRVEVFTSWNVKGATE
jgi:hypothetical protein